MNWLSSVQGNERTGLREGDLQVMSAISTVRRKMMRSILVIMVLDSSVSTLNRTYE